MLLIEVGRSGEPESLKSPMNNLKTTFCTKVGWVVSVVFQKGEEHLQLLLVVAEDLMKREEVVVPLRDRGPPTLLFPFVPVVNRFLVGDDFCSDPPRIRIVPTRTNSNTRLIN